VTVFIPDSRLLDSPRHRPWPDPSVPLGRPEGRRPPRAADVVIVGAGPAGLAVAAALWHRGVRDVVLVDSSGAPCRRFLDRVDVLAQHVLRSPYEHHPGAEGYRDCELLDFARLHWSLLTTLERREIRMSQSGHRSVVPVDVFEAFCRHVAVTHRADLRTWPGTVRELVPAADRVEVRGDGFELTARFAVLCLGEDRRDAPRTWWRTAAGAERVPGDVPGRVTYWDEPAPEHPRRVAVVGAGLSAAHVIAKGLAAGRRIDWILRADAERYQCSDVNVAFFRAEGRARFAGPAAWEDRLALIRAHRRASVMFEFQPLLRAAEGSRQLRVHRGRAVTGVTSRPGAVTVQLSGGGRVTTDHVVLALGTVPSTGAEILPAGVVGARDGWPDLEESTLAYRRAPRVFAVGAAAGMILGPAARNIDGHRVATGRVAAAIAAGLREDGRTMSPDRRGRVDGAVPHQSAGQMVAVHA
jgi:Pyridine nucleotide-disulphide oxidoreductase